MRSLQFRYPIIILLLIVNTVLSSQDTASVSGPGQPVIREYGVDYNDKYRSPFAFGVEYQSLSPISLAYEEEYRFSDLALSGRYSFKEYPEIQPFGTLGLQFVSPLRITDEVGDAERFSHTLYSGAL
jgi:hypothetical protein